VTRAHCALLAFLTARSLYTRARILAALTLTAITSPQPSIGSPRSALLIRSESGRHAHCAVILTVYTFSLRLPYSHPPERAYSLFTLRTLFLLALLTLLFSLCPDCALTMPSLQSQCAVTMPSLHSQCALTVPSLVTSVPI
jgi:hypothetical protein